MKFVEQWRITSNKIIVAFKRSFVMIDKEASFF